MEDILTKLRALGVHIPTGLGEEQLLLLAKILNPWIANTGISTDGCYATTKLKQLTGKENASTSYGATQAEAAMKLLLKQMEAGAFTAQSTTYKQSSMAYCANQ